MRYAIALTVAAALVVACGERPQEAPAQATVFAQYDRSQPRPTPTQVAFSALMGHTPTPTRDMSFEEALSIPCDDERLESMWELLSRIRGQGEDYYVAYIMDELEFNEYRAERLYTRCYFHLEDLMHRNLR